MSDPQYSAVSAWRAAAEARDSGRAAACLTDEVELVSPLTEQFRFHGREQVRELLDVAFEVLTDIHIHTQVVEGSTCALFATANVAGQPAEEAQLLRLDDDGRIGHLTLFFRPLPALTCLLAALGPRLARQQRRPALAGLLAVSTEPLHTMARTGERRVVPLAAPRPAAAMHKASGPGAWLRRYSWPR